MLNQETNKALRTLFDAQGVKYASTSRNIDLLRAALTFKGVSFGFDESKDQLLAKLLKNGSF